MNQVNISKNCKEFMKKVFGTDSIDQLKKMAETELEIEDKLLPYIAGDGTPEEEELAEDILDMLSDEED